MRFGLLAVVLSVGCGTGLQDRHFATGSATIVATARGVVNVNEDEGTLSRFDPDTGTTVELALGDRPARVARVKDTAWVTLRGERAIAIVDVSGEVMSLVEKIPAGIEPYGIVANEKGTRVYVASSRTNEILEFDAASREILRTVAVPDEPRWLALHPSGKALYVASLFHGTFSHIDLETGERTPIELPTTTRLGVDRGTEIALTPRFTGDPAVDAAGREVVLPLVFVDNETPVDSQKEGEIEDPEFPNEGGGGYGSSGLGISRLNPALITVDVGTEGDVQGQVEAAFLATASSGTIREPMKTDVPFESGVVRSYPTSVTITRDAYLVTAESSSALYAVSRTPFSFGDSTFSTDMVDTGGGGAMGARLPFTSPEDGGFVSLPVVAIPTDAGPRGVAMLDANTAVVHTFLGRSVSELDVLRVNRDVRQMQSNFFAELFEPRVRASVQVAEQRLTHAEERGRAMFYSADDARMAGAGAGVSCSTCHFDSRNDGFTWTIDGRSFQTPSLAGPVSQTAPVTWADDVVSVAREAQLTTGLRMGGEGLSDREAADIGEYVDTTPYPEGMRDDDDAAVARGRVVFQESGCVSCHTGPNMTDNLSHEVFPGMATQTPTLRGVAASAPYLHDGSALTLLDVLQSEAGRRMADVSSLSDEQRNDLVAFLESL